MLTFRCSCGKAYVVEEKRACEAIVCDRCHALITVPAASTPVFGPSFTESLHASEAWDQPAAPVPPERRARWPLAAGLVAGALALLLVGFFVGRRQSPGEVRVPIRAAAKAPAAPVELRTGTDIYPPAAGAGRGKLTIVNGTDRDAVVKLCGPGRVGRARRHLYRFVYVSKHESYTVSGIAPGSFDVLFSLGQDWDAGAKRFRERLCARFEQPLLFEQIETPTESRYSTFTLTLHRVVDGKARTQQIPDDEFDSVR